MPKTQKSVALANLASFSVLVNDTDPNSRYFQLGSVPDVLTGGKNAFLINGSPELNPTTEVKIEIIDALGNTIFLQPVKNYQEGLARVVSIEIYEDTPPGIATMTILGELRRTADGNPVPPEWVGVYNVKFTRQFSVQPSAVNSTKVRLYNPPEISVKEVLVPYLAPFTSSIAIVTGSGVLKNVRTSQFLSQQNPVTDINTFWLTGFPTAFVSDMLGGTVFAPAFNYTGSVIRVFNSSSIQLSTGSAAFSTTSTPISLSYQPAPTFTATSLTKSLADIKLTNLTTFSGEIARTKIYVESLEQSSVFQLLSDHQLQSISLLTTASASGVQNVLIGDFDSRLGAINNYWRNGTADSVLGYSFTPVVTMSYNSARIENAAFNTGNPTVPQYFFGTKTPLIFSESLEYTFIGNLACFKAHPSYDTVCNVYLSGSAFPVANPLGYLVQTYDVPGGAAYTVFDKSLFNFIALSTGQATLNFVITGSLTNSPPVTVFNDPFTAANNTYLNIGGGGGRIGPYINPLGSAYLCPPPDVGNTIEAKIESNAVSVTRASFGNAFWVKTNIGVNDNITGSIDINRGSPAANLTEGLALRANAVVGPGPIAASNAITVQAVYNGSNSDHDNRPDLHAYIYISGTVVNDFLLTSSYYWPTGSWKTLGMSLLGSQITPFVSDQGGGNFITFSSVTLPSASLLTENYSGFVGKALIFSDSHDQYDNLVITQPGTANVSADAEWNIADVDINGSTENGFNLDEIEMIVPLTGRRFESLLFKAELFDPNSNIIPIDVESAPIKFNGGNAYIQGTDNRIVGQFQISIEGDSGPGVVVAAHPSASVVGAGTSTAGPVFPVPPQLLTAYTGSGFVTMYTGSNPFNGGQTPATASVGLQIMGGPPSSSFLDFNTYTGVLSIRGDISLLPGTALSQSIVSSSSGIDALARSQILQIVSGTFPNGTYLTGQSIFSPTITGLVIGGIQGYIRDTLRVGNVLNGNGVIITATGFASSSVFYPNAPAIFIGGDSSGTGSYLNPNTPFLIGSSSSGPLFSLTTSSSFFSFDGRPGGVMMLQTPFIQISSSIFSLDTFAPTASMDLGVVSIDPLGTGVTMNAGGYFRAGESPLVPGAKNIVFDPSTGLFNASAVAIASGRYNGIIDTSVNLPAISSVSESVFWGKKAKANVLQAMTSSFIGGPYLLTSEVLPNTSASIDTTIPGSLVIHSGSTYGTIFEAGTFTHVIGGTSVTPFTAHSTIAQTSSSLQGNTPGPGFDVWLRSSPAEALLINFSPGDQLVGGQITVAMPWRIHEFNSVNPSYHCQITGYVSASWSQPSVSSSIPPTDYSASFADSAVVTTAGIYGSTGFVTLNNIMPGPNNTVYLSFIYNFVTGLL